ncbi:uncharacterized protein LOC133173478 [Saccostrea echinata]|uniref:uncharacterized protein LOC133173478 n=1 Tax=Saccostrea echinata TaxID=191078 RepID=UPI002A82AEB2|nr:uncharacterized protein LOC133173478 [Saccostrea echinata]
MAEVFNNLVVRSSFGRIIKQPKHGSLEKVYGQGTVDIKPPGLEEHYRTNLEKLLSRMGQHVEQSVIMMAKMEYTELMALEKKLKQLDPKRFQKTSESQPKASYHIDQMWGPQLFHIIQKSMETPVKNLSNDALRELNALQRSARAYEEIIQQSADGSPREPQIRQNLSGSLLVKRKPQTPTPNHHAPNKGGPMKAVHQEYFITKPLYKAVNTSANKPDFSNSITKGSSKDNYVNRSITSASRPPSSQAYKSQHRSGSIFISKEEYDRLHKKIKQQEMQIEELTTRLSSFASKQLLAGNPNMADLSDKNRPTKIGEKFGSLYDEEWSDAYDAFQTQLRYTEEECLRVLLRILRYAYDFCKKASETQLSDLSLSMERHILHPASFHGNSMSNSTNLTSSVGSVDVRLDESQGKVLRSVCNRHSKEFRKAAGLKSVPELQEVFKKQMLRKNFQLEPRQLPKPILAYIDVCIEVTWLMCIQDPPMVITWATEGEAINKDYYKLYKTNGSVVKVSVWPVLFLHSRGPIVSKGYVYPFERKV